MSDNPDKVPETLSTITPLPAPKPGEWEPRTRRPRSNLANKRANTPLPVMPGEDVFRIVPDNKTIREWAAGRKIEVSGKGKIPRKVREAFDEWFKWNGAWTVRIVSLRRPGATESSAYFRVMQGGYLVKETTDPFYVKRALGPELYALMTPPPRRRKERGEDKS